MGYHISSVVALLCANSIQRPVANVYGAEMEYLQIDKTNGRESIARLAMYNNIGECSHMGGSGDEPWELGR